MKTVCPLRCRQQRDTAGGNSPGDRASAHVQVDWAGLSVDLDLAFSQQQCDRVYTQHLMRKHESQLWRWLRDGTPPCGCEIAAGNGELNPDTVKESLRS